ncbi:hypothetical protein JCM6882_005500 [Rhodosporidiobolus microsporus]
MAPSAYEQERAVAISAVLKASLLAQKVQQQLIGSGGVEKKDKSPVTVGDYTSQALVSSLLFSHFPMDQIVGEEDSSELQKPSNENTKAQIVRLAGEAMSEPLPLADEEQFWAPVKAVERGEKEWLDIIDRGNSTGGKEGRHWALDPIDGTKGFLRGGQYAVCLGLLKDGEVVLGVMGCPNLPVDPKNPEGEKGALFVAVKGEGAFQRSFSSPALTPISMSTLASLSSASFCESVEAGHSDHGTNARIAQLLGITKDSVRMDSQAKYCSIARGDGDIYLRLPVSDTYEEKIWDHSSGSLLVEEAGGVVSDMNGKPLDFSLGRTLKGNKGVVAAHRDWHAKVIEAVQQATPEQLEDLRATFKLYDKDGNGTICAEDLGIAFRALGQDLGKEEYEKMVQRADLDKTGSIDFEEFVAAVQRRPKPSNLEAELRQAFRFFDKDGCGTISPAELKHVMESLGERLSDAEIDHMIKAVDKDGDGLVSFEEFVALITS